MFIYHRHSQSTCKKLFTSKWYPNKITRKSEDIVVYVKNLGEYKGNLNYVYNINNMFYIIGLKAHIKT